MQLELKQLKVPPGSILEMQYVSWQMLETILEELGEVPSSRISIAKELWKL